jgi:3-deoxy-D-arabino-heptulosonate 7-phosphate (DAHP) synthase
LVVRVEPWLNRALAFAKGAGLIELEKGKSAKLTAAGLTACEVLYKQSSMCAEEKAFLEAVGARATEAAVEKIMRMELAL